MRGKSPTYRQRSLTFPVYDRSPEVGDLKDWSETCGKSADLPRIGGERPDAGGGNLHKSEVAIHLVGVKREHPIGLDESSILIPLKRFQELVRGFRSPR